MHERPSKRHAANGTNIPGYERIGTIALGSALATFGLTRRSIPGWAIAVAGATLALRGIVGIDPVYRYRARREGVRLHHSVIIQRPRREVYRMWREPTNLPRFMKHVAVVEPRDDRTSHWVATYGPATVEWVSEITDDQPDRRLAWRTISGDVEHEGMIELSEAPGGRGSLLDVSMSFVPPAATLTRLFKGLLRFATEQQLAADLIRLRQLLETGEIATGASRREDLDEDEQVMSAPIAAAAASKPSPPASPPRSEAPEAFNPKPEV